MGERTDAEVIAASFTMPASFGTIFERHATVLHRYLIRRVGVDEAEGLVGEVFRIALDIPLGTVRSRLNRARLRLRELTGVDGEQHDSSETLGG